MESSSGRHRRHRRGKVEERTGFEKTGPNKDGGVTNETNKTEQTKAKSGKSAKCTKSKKCLTQPRFCIDNCEIVIDGTKSYIFLEKPRIRA